MCVGWVGGWVGVGVGVHVGVGMGVGLGVSLSVYLCLPLCLTVCLTVCLSVCLGEGGGDLVNQAAPALDVTSARSAATTSRSRAPPGFSVQRV